MDCGKPSRELKGNLMLKKSAGLVIVLGLLIPLSKYTYAKNNNALSSPDIAKPAPQFTLPNLDGKEISLKNLAGKYVVLEWTNYSCPFVKKHYKSGKMQKLQKEFREKGIVWLSICSSALGKEGYMEPNEWRLKIKAFKSNPTDILLDPQGQVGRLYGAKTTPHMFIVNPKGLLIYKGAIDDTPSIDASDIPKSKNYVRQALEEALSGKPVSAPITQPYGCSVKY